MTCRVCGLPVVAPSMGGADMCPWCDMGIWRDGREWTFREMIAMIGKNRDEKRAYALAEFHTRGTDE